MSLVHFRLYIIISKGEEKNKTEVTVLDNPWQVIVCLLLPIADSRLLPAQNTAMLGKWRWIL